MCENGYPRSKRMSDSMVKAFETMAMNAGLHIKRSPSSSREEILTGALLAAGLSSSGGDLVSALLQTGPSATSYQVEDVYAPPSPIDLVLMLHRADEHVHSSKCRFSVAVEVKRFGTPANGPAYRDGWAAFLTAEGDAQAQQCGGLWQTDIAGYTHRGMGWRETCERSNGSMSYPVRRWVVLAPSEPKEKLDLDELFPGMHTHNRWRAVSYHAFARKLIRCVEQDAHSGSVQSDDHPLMPVLRLLYPLVP